MTDKQINPNLRKLAELTYNPKLKLDETLFEKESEVSSQISPSIFSTKDFWKISGVNYRNGIYSVDLSKTLLDSGNARTQDNWAKHREQAIAKGELYTGDMPLYHSLFTALFKQKDESEAEEARKFIQKQMRDKWLMTLTRIAYQPKGEDKVIHNYNTKDKYELEANIVGADRVIETGDSQALEAILGTGLTTEINSVYNWINQTPTYIWRLNNKPKKVDERVARFDAGSDWADLSCVRHPVIASASLGVRLVVRPKGTSSKK